MPVNLSKKNELPTPLVEDTIYLIPSASDAELVELHITGNTNSVIKRISTKEDIEAQITDALGTLEIDIDQITATGTPSSTTYLRGDNTWATVSGGGGSAKLAVNIGDGVNLVYDVPHDFNTTDLIIGVHYNSGDKARVLVQTETPSTSIVRVTFDPTPPTTNQFRVVIMG